MKLHECTNSRFTMRWRLLRRMGMWMVAACIMATSFSSFAGVFISVGIAPPPLPVYVQPAVPGDGYIWTPGYWSYAEGGYFWVPGTWVLAPYAGALWTPGYWGWNNGFYVFNAGYWGPRVGFYGGINYGYGYGGVGYSGGYWNHGRFAYNRNVINNASFSRVSYNGGRGGLMARPTPQEQMASRDRHIAPVAAQQQQVRLASQNRALRASVNHGAPAIAATQRPGVFSGSGVVRANGATTPAAARATRTSGAASAARNVRTSSRRTSQTRTTTAQRSTSHATRSRSVQRSAQSNRPATRSTAAHRPATRSYQQARPQARAQARPQAQPRRQPAARAEAQRTRKPEHR